MPKNNGPIPVDNNNDVIPETGEIDLTKNVDSDEKGFIASTPDEKAKSEYDVNIQPDAEGSWLEDTGEIEVVREPKANRIARAVQVVDGKVVNVLLVGVDSDDKPVGYEVPYGSELFVIEDDSKLGIGDKYDSSK